MMEPKHMNLDEVSKPLAVLELAAILLATDEKIGGRLISLDQLPLKIKIKTKKLFINLKKRHNTTKSLNEVSPSNILVPF